MFKFRTKSAERKEIEQAFRLDFHQFCPHSQSVAKPRPSCEIASIRSFMRIKGIKRFKGILNKFYSLRTATGEIGKCQAADEVSERRGDIAREVAGLNRLRTSRQLLERMERYLEKGSGHG